MGRRTWTDTDIQILRDNFPDGGIYKCVALLPHKTKKQIKDKLSSLHIKSNKYNKWTEEENKILEDAWENDPMEILLAKFPDRSYNNIMQHANHLAYRSKIKRNRKSNLSFLELDNLTKESLYWWGFIMADGHISKRGDIIISLKNVDKQHLEKYAKKVNGHLRDKKNGFVEVSCSDIKRVEKWKKIFNMKKTAKTYFPPNLNVFEKDFIYFFIGFLDGDGCVWLSRNYPQIRVEVHLSWKDNLDWFAEVLRRDYNILSAKTKIGKKDTAILTIGNRKDILLILEYAKEVDYLERKWNKLFEYVPTRHDNMTK